MGEIVFDDEIPYGDEIRLTAGWVDLISSTSVDIICNADFILAQARISFYYRGTATGHRHIAAKGGNLIETHFIGGCHGC